MLFLFCVKEIYYWKGYLSVTEQKVYFVNKATGPKYIAYIIIKLPAAVTSPDQYSNHCHHK